MKEVEIEALITFKYSPNGTGVKIAPKGLEFMVSEKLAKKLTAGDPPRAKYLGEVDDKAEDEIAEEEIIEDEPTTEEVVEEIVDNEEMEIDLSFDEEPVEINGELVDEDEKVEENTGDYEDFPAYKTIVELDELKAIIKNADKKDDEVELGAKFVALRKSGAWFNVFNKVTDEVENKTGMKLDDAMAEFVYELYLK